MRGEGEEPGGAGGRHHSKIEGRWGESSTIGPAIGLLFRVKSIVINPALQKYTKMGLRHGGPGHLVSHRSDPHGLPLQTWKAVHHYPRGGPRGSTMLVMQCQEALGVV